MTGLDNSQKPVFDSNSNFVDNEFSDDEDVVAKPADSIGGIVSTFISGVQSWLRKSN